MRLPDFLIIGAQKSGTTALRTLLSQHPDLHLHPQELHFFSSHRNYSRGLDAYARKFSGISQDKLVGEKSPDYLYHIGSAAKIKSTMPDCKLIALLRNPVARAYSHYKMSVRNFREPLSLEAALKKEPGRYLHTPNEWLDYGSARWKYSYSDRGHYMPQLQCYLKHFSERQLLVVLHEELLEHRSETLNRIFHFLGVKPLHPSRIETFQNADTIPRGAQSFPLRLMLEHCPYRVRRFARRHLPSIPAVPFTISLQTMLYEKFQPEIEELELFLQKDLSAWKPF